MNDIVTKQNTDISIKRLAAQRALYSKAKFYLKAQFILGVPFTILIAIAAVALDKGWFSSAPKDITWMVGLSGISLFFVIDRYLMPAMDRLKETAAKIQQSFDSDVLDIPFCQITYGKPIDRETTEKWATKGSATGVSTSEFRNWYSVEVAPLPMEVARIICQSANCWWDQDLRRRYNYFIYGIGICLLVVITGIVLYLDSTITTIFGLIAPLLLPFLVVASKETQANRDAITRLDAMKLTIDDACQKILDDEIADQDLILLANAIQASIYQNRRNNPLVFDKLHELLKAEHEDTLKKTTAEFVEQYQRRHTNKKGRKAI